jgi:hypothetical protein
VTLGQTDCSASFRDDPPDQPRAPLPPSASATHPFSFHNHSAVVAHLLALAIAAALAASRVSKLFAQPSSQFRVTQQHPASRATSAGHTCPCSRFCGDRSIPQSATTPPWASAARDVMPERWLPVVGHRAMTSTTRAGSGAKPQVARPEKVRPSASSCQRDHAPQGIPGFSRALASCFIEELSLGWKR